MNYVKLLIKQMIPFTLKLGMIFLALILLGWIGSAIVFTSASTNLVAPGTQSMSVTGTAKKKVSPDSAQITLGKIYRGTQPAEMQTKAGTAVNSLTAKLKALGVKDEEIRTSNYSVNPTYDKNGDPDGYQLNVSVEVTLEKQNPQQELLSKIITAGSESGIDVVNGLNFYLSDYEQQVKDLNTAAIADAKFNAQKQADAAGAHIGKVLNINSGSYYPYYSNTAAGRDVAAPSVAPSPEKSIQFNVGQFDLQASVTVTFELN